MKEELIQAIVQEVVRAVLHSLIEHLKNRDAVSADAGSGHASYDGPVCALPFASLDDRDRLNPIVTETC